MIAGRQTVSHATLDAYLDCRRPWMAWGVQTSQITTPKQETGKVRNYWNRFNQSLCVNYMESRGFSNKFTMFVVLRCLLLASNGLASGKGSKNEFILS